MPLYVCDQLNGQSPLPYHCNLGAQDVGQGRADDAKNKGLKEQTSNVYGNGHTSLFADVIDAINNDRKPYVDAAAGRGALEVVLWIYKSQKTCEPVKLPLEGFASTIFSIVNSSD